MEPSINTDVITGEGNIAVSARNQLKGEISDVVLGTIMAHRAIQVGGNVIESVDTGRSAGELKLKKAIRRPP